MYNLKLIIAYDGTNYAGWQVQKNANTVQAEIEKALKKILRERVRIIGAGRTDSGVHAKAQVANFKTEKPATAESGRHLFCQKLKNALNASLPGAIRVTGVKKVSEKFHSQYDAKAKTYRYAILNGGIDDPFLDRYYFRVQYPLNVLLMKKEAKALIGKHDFKSFQAKANLSPIKDTKRTVKKIAVKKKGRFIYLDFEADGFLHNMVRNIAGTLIETGRGYLPPGSMKKILLSKNRRKAGPTAPARGLTLVRVKY